MKRRGNFHPQHNRVFRTANQSPGASRHLTKRSQKVAKHHPFPSSSTSMGALTLPPCLLLPHEKATNDDFSAGLRPRPLATRSVMPLLLPKPCLRYVCRRVGNLGGSELNCAMSLTVETPPLLESGLIEGQATLRQRVTRWADTLRLTAMTLRPVTDRRSERNTSCHRGYDAAGCRK